MENDNDKQKDKHEPKDIKSMFEKYTEAAGNKGKLLLEDAKQWFKRSNFIGKNTGKTESEFDESFAKVAKDKAGMTYEEFKGYIQTFAKEVKMEANELTDGLASSLKLSKDDLNNIKTVFEQYTEAAGNKGKLLLEDAKKWFEKANLIGKKTGKTVSEFNESFAKDKVSMTYVEFKGYVETLAKDVKMDMNELINKLADSQKLSEDKKE